MLRKDVRLIALDFETTGLDPMSDEPIQIGIVEFNHEGKIVGGFQSLIRPEKPTKELKTIVGFITGLSVEKLQSAPSRDQVQEEMASFFGENTVIIGHNINFDLGFLENFFPDLHWKSSIDTFRLSQALIHYVPSYALEVLIDLLKTKPTFQQVLKQLQIDLEAEVNFHDAFFDAKLSIALFGYLVERVKKLMQEYPIVEYFISLGEGNFSDLFSINESSKPIQAITLPPLKKVAPPYTQMLTGPYALNLTSEMESQQYSVANLELKSLLATLATNKQSILAFSNKSKLDIAKNMLNDLGIKNLGFVKEEQTLNPDALKGFANKGAFTQEECYFLLKYFSHLEQGLGVLDLNSKEDYEIYTALKDQRATVNYPIILATHGGLFSLLEQREKYQGYSVFFFDLEWRYKSYNFYLSRPYDFNYTLNYLDMLVYKYGLQYQISLKNPEAGEKLKEIEEFRWFFTLFTGILGQETKAFFTNTDMTKQTLPPLKGNLSFHQTNKLLERFSERESRLQSVLQNAEFRAIRKQIEHVQTIFESMMIVEKKMYSQSGFYFVYAEEVRFTNWDEFVEEFMYHPTIFLSHSDVQLPLLISQDSEQKEENSESVSSLPVVSEEVKPQFKNDLFASSKVCRLSKTPSVLKAIEAFDCKAFPNGVIFILSVQKEESKVLFESMISQGLDQTFSLLVENITGGSGKNLFKAKQQGPKVIVGGYNFLLQLFAQKIAISQLIIYNSRGNQQDVIFSDIAWYGQHNLS